MNSRSFILDGALRCVADPDEDGPEPASKFHGMAIRALIFEAGCNAPYGVRSGRSTALGKDEGQGETLSTYPMTKIECLRSHPRWHASRFDRLADVDSLDCSCWDLVGALALGGNMVKVATCDGGPRQARSFHASSRIGS